MSTRTRKTRQQRAQEALDAANSRVKRLAETEARLTSELTGVRKALYEAEEQAKYAAQNPALPKAVDLAEGGDEEGADE